MLGTDFIYHLCILFFYFLIKFIFLGHLEQGLPTQQFLLLQPSRVLWRCRDHWLLSCGPQKHQESCEAHFPPKKSGNQIFKKSSNQFFFTQAILFDQ